MNQKTLCVDFDGVLHSYTTGWKGAGVVTDGPVPGAMQWLRMACRRYQVCIYSSRSKDPAGIQAMREALRAWATAELSTDDASLILASLSFPTEKPPAWLTIDDRAICFEGTWPTAEEIDAFVPWYRR